MSENCFCARAQKMVACPCSAPPFTVKTTFRGSCVLAIHCKRDEAVPFERAESMT
jgi:hypothetical protein